MVNIFKIYVLEKVKCKYRPRTCCFYNIPCHVTLIYPNERSGYIWNNALIDVHSGKVKCKSRRRWGRLVGGNRGGGDGSDGGEEDGDDRDG